MAPSRNKVAPYVKVDKKKGKDYYYYRMPDGSLESLGSNKKIAVSAANLLTSKLRPEGDIVETILNRNSQSTSKQNPLLRDVITEFIERSLKVDVAEKRLGEKTYALKLLVAKEYQSVLGDIPVKDVTTFILTSHLKDRTGNTQVKHIALLNKIFKFAIGNCGYRETNPVSQMIAKKIAPRSRKRLTIERLNTIRAASPTWLRRAIDIALYSLQRRGDLILMHIDTHVDRDNQTIKVLQEKTRRYANPVFIEIKAGEQLWSVTNEAIKSDIPCPYLIHARPKAMVRSSSRPHPFALLPDYLTKQFQKYRDLSGAYDHLPKKERPTFHSIRALGIMLYFKAGYDFKYIMALAGHADEKTTQLYIEGHEKKQAIKVSAGLNLEEISVLDIDWADSSMPQEIASLITESDDGKE
jgi:integrase